MRSGRPPPWNIAEGFGGDAWTGVVELNSKDRLLLPTSVRRRIPWLAGGTDQQVLAEIQGDAVELRPWGEVGNQLVNKLETAATALTADRLQDLVIATMDRYARLSVGGDGRTVLPSHLAHHLVPRESDMIRVVVRGGRIWLWSEANWAKKRQDRHLDLDRLLVARD
jgi:DNA-binding transcriptional regulator/RsmH inhibitor MraZ